MTARERIAEAQAAVDRSWQTYMAMAALASSDAAQASGLKSARRLWAKAVVALDALDEIEAES